MLLFAKSSFEDISLMEQFTLSFGTLGKLISIIQSIVKNTMAINRKKSLQMHYCTLWESADIIKKVLRKWWGKNSAVPSAPRKLNKQIFSYSGGFCAKFHHCSETLNYEQISDLELLLKGRSQVTD